MLKVAIIGKPNVGKSTLFNKLCGKRLAITNDIAGVTRDVKAHQAKIYDFEFELLDTAGLEFSKKNSALTTAMTDFALNAAMESDIIIFLIDARHGLTFEDSEFAKKIRKLSKQVILVANKAEGKKNIEVRDVLKLGFGEAVFISAEHMQGFDDLRARIISQLPKEPEAEQAIALEEPSKHLKVCFLGRPNVGKSSIFNKILGFDRNIVSDVAGTTRDSIHHFIEYDGREIELIDTAGMRKRKNIDEELETLATVESINALRRSHVVILIIDALSPLDKQEQNLLRIAVKEGRSIVVVVNKIDLIKNLKEFKQELVLTIEESLFDISGVEIVFVSALKKINIDNIIKAAIKAELVWNTSISTGKLNKWLELTTSTHIPPIASNGRRIRFKYVTQTATRPPTFTIFANIPAAIPESYTRYLLNDMRKNFNLPGTPIRIKYRKIDNPYSK